MKVCIVGIGKKVEMLFVFSKVISTDLFLSISAQEDVLDCCKRCLLYFSNKVETKLYTGRAAREVSKFQ